MTFVELFDRAQTENAVNIAAYRPEKVIFIGENRFLKKRKNFFEAYLAARNMDTELVFRSVPSGNLPQLIETLEEIVRQETELCIDLTGGSDLALTAAGVIMERYKDRNICFRRYNIRTGALTICGGPEPEPAPEKPALSVEENIILHGGCIIDNFFGGPRPDEWKFTDELREDIRTIWDISRKDPREWNTELMDLAYAVAQFDICTQEEAAVYIDNLLRKPIGRRLYDCGMLQLTGGPAFCYKSPEVGYILSKSGNILEIMTMLSAKDARLEGQPIFGDVRTSVFIDWDGMLHDCLADDVTNEIDVVMMRGLVPIFVSCKFGKMSLEELYKLNAVADHFGGKYVKKFLLTASETIMKVGGMAVFLERAAALGIQVITDIQTRSADEFRRLIEKQMR